MVTRITLLGTLWLAAVAAGDSALAQEKSPAQDKPTSEARLAELERKLNDIESRMIKLDLLADELKKLRNEDLPNLEKNLRGAIPTSGRVEKEKPEAESSVLAKKDAGTVRREAQMPVESKQGRLVIENLTAEVRGVTVNGMTAYFRPGTTEMTIPYGEVVTQMSPWEAPEKWDAAQWRDSSRGPEMRLQLRY